MKSHTLVQNILKIAIIFILALACMNMSVLATDPTDPNNDPADPVEATPYINFEIKTTKLEDGSKQVLVECWGKDFENLVGLDFVFQYDNNKLTPSYLNEAGKTNKVLNDLDTIQYVNRPEIQSDEEAFFNNSKTILSDSFKLNNELVNIEEKPILKTYVLRYEESRFEDEEEIAKTIMVSISKNDLITEVSDEGTNPKGVKIGTFSFRLADGQTVSTEDFNLIRTLIMCDDGKTTDPEGEEELSLYERDITSADPLLINIEDIAKFLLGDEPTGSISGTISAGIANENVSFTSSNITTIKIFDATAVSNINFNPSGKAINYGDIVPIIEYTTTEEENGEFLINDINYGTYVIVFDKEYYSEVIIKNVTIDDNNKEIDFNNIDNVGTISLIPGDINKDGKINATDTLAYNADLKNDKIVNLDDKETVRKKVVTKNTASDTLIYNLAIQTYGRNKKTQAVRKVIEL